MQQNLYLFHHICHLQIHHRFQSNIVGFSISSIHCGSAQLVSSHSKSFFARFRYLVVTLPFNCAHFIHSLLIFRRSIDAPYVLQNKFPFKISSSLSFKITAYEKLGQTAKLKDAIIPNVAIQVTSEYVAEIYLFPAVDAVFFCFSSSSSTARWRYPSMKFSVAHKGA